MRVIVLGGAGNFGARIVRALQADPGIELLMAARRTVRVTGADAVPVVLLNIDSPEFATDLSNLKPQLVVHCIGPFQGQDYRVAKAALAADAHYIDLADGRRFVVDFANEIDAIAREAGKVAISGSSTLPALSSAVVEELRRGLRSLDSIDIVIAPGQRAPRGVATLAAVLSYLGRPFPVWKNGAWRRAWGWMDLREVRMDLGSRLAAACDVPDLELFPRRFAGVQTVTFHAALEFGFQHLALWCLAGLRRMGLPLPVSRWAAGLNKVAGLFDAAGGPSGGMRVRVQGVDERGRSVARTWQVVAPAESGPEIPCMAAILLARRLASGDTLTPGASACMGYLSLSEFAPEFKRWDMTTRIEEELL